MRPIADIDARLENWSRWLHSGSKGGADCMTGAVCERMRRASLGDVWSGHQVHYDTSEKDAWEVEQAMHSLGTKTRLLLWWCYYKQARPEIICSRLSIQPRPVSILAEAICAAKDVLKETLDRNSKGV